MSLEAAVREIKALFPGLLLLENEPMARHCSFRIGGPVPAFALPASVSEAAALSRALRERDVTPLIMGNGTNLLVTDEPLARFVVRLGEGMSAVERRGETGLYAASGALLSRLASAAAAYGLSGLEFAHGIPGSVGGAASMNAGAYGGFWMKRLPSGRSPFPRWTSPIVTAAFPARTRSFWASPSSWRPGSRRPSPRV
jgi:UDP-N-acetylmuramate dehydrogenase